MLDEVLGHLYEAPTCCQSESCLLSLLSLGIDIGPVLH